MDSITLVANANYKLNVIPTQEIEFLGFLLSSILMTIRLPPTKAACIRIACQRNCPRHWLDSVKFTCSSIWRIVLQESRKE